MLQWNLKIEMKIARVEENWMTMKEKRNSSAFMFTNTIIRGKTKDVANSNELKIINEKNYNFSLTQSRNKKCARDDHEKK